MAYIIERKCPTTLVDCRNLGDVWWTVVFRLQVASVLQIVFSMCLVDCRICLQIALRTNLY